MRVHIRGRLKLSRDVDKKYLDAIMRHALQEAADDCTVPCSGHAGYFERNCGIGFLRPLQQFGANAGCALGIASATVEYFESRARKHSLICRAGALDRKRVV